MKRMFSLLFFVMGICHPPSAQDSCGCLENLDQMIGKVTANYAGYRDKVNDRTKSDYTRLLDSLRLAARGDSSSANCNQLFDRYRRFFYDKHLQMRMFPVAARATGTAPAAGGNAPVVTNWNRQNILAVLKNHSASLKALEGIWETEGYEIGIFRDGSTNNYRGIVLESSNPAWKKGMQKLSSMSGASGLLDINYRNGNFIIEKVRANLIKNYLEIENYGIWRRNYPVTEDTLSKSTFLSKHQVFGDFQFRQLDDSTLYIRLKSCDLSLKSLVDSTLAGNQKLLQRIPKWIIDFRGNQGGATDVFLSLLPFLYTKPFIEKGSDHWMTPGATTAFDEFLSENKGLLDSSTFNQIASLVSFGKTNPGGWFHSAGDTTVYPEILPYPRKVAILSDHNNASSGETFLMISKGISDKVTILGENSAGYLDYGDLLPFKMPCAKLELNIPSRRANYLDAGFSYDRTGYAPDIYIPSETKDWIDFTYRYWRLHP